MLPGTLTSSLPTVEALASDLGGLREPEDDEE